MRLNVREKILPQCFFSKSNLYFFLFIELLLKYTTWAEQVGRWENDIGSRGYASRIQMTKSLGIEKWWFYIMPNSFCVYVCVFLQVLVEECTKIAVYKFTHWTPISLFEKNQKCFKTIGITSSHTFH